MQTRSYCEILKDFNRAIQWLESLNIRVENTRFERIQKDIKDLVEVAKTREIGKFDDPDEWRAGAYALIEAEDLIRICHAYGERSSPKLVKRLRHAVKGPRSGTTESTKNNLARNILAELSWGASLEQAGYSTFIEYDPDILQVLEGPEGYSISWEVKRLLSIRNMPKQLRDGANQIVEAMLGKKNVGDTTLIGGCIVIIVDEILGVERQVLLASNESSARAGLQDEIVKWWKNNKKALNNCWKPGVLGVVLWWRLLGVTHSHYGVPVLTDCQQHVFDDTIGSPDKWNLDYLRRIFKDIRR